MSSASLVPSASPGFLGALVWIVVVGILMVVRADLIAAGAAEGTDVAEVTVESGT